MSVFVKFVFFFADADGSVFCHFADGVFDTFDVVARRINGFAFNPQLSAVDFVRPVFRRKLRTTVRDAIRIVRIGKRIRAYIRDTNIRS